MLRPIILALTLALAASPALADPAPVEQPKAGQQSGYDSLPVAAKRFWEERASETRRINGELWSIRVKLAGERQAAIKTPQAQAMALAWQQPGAPNYIRLHDGKSVRTLAEIAQDIEGVTVLEGLVVEVVGDAMVFRPIKARGYGYASAVRINGLTPQQQKEWSALVVSEKDLKERKQNKAGHGKPHELVAVRKGEDQPARYTLVDITIESVTPEELQMICRQHNITAWPDPRPILESPRPDFDRMNLYGTEKLVQITAWEAAKYDRQDFRWSNHTIIIPPAAR